jgi:hypothetical protein
MTSDEQWDPTVASKEDLDFLAARANAIQAYAQLEMGLFQLFCRLGEIRESVGGVIFFHIASTRLRNRILEKLFRNKFGSAFNYSVTHYLKHSIKSIQRAMKSFIGRFSPILIKTMPGK